MSASSTAVRLGLIGCGAIAKRHLDDLREDRRAEFVVFCDPRQASAATLRDQYAPNAGVEGDFEKAIAQYSLDGVIVCSPNALHFGHVMRALDERVHVLCEKPLAVTREQITTLIQRQEQTGLVLSIAHQRRYWPLYSTARRELTENADYYGPIQQVHVFTCEHWGQGIAGSWRDDPTQNAGYFGDAGIHQIDVVFYLANQRAERLVAASNRRDHRVEIVTRVMAELTGGMGLGVHHVGDAHHFREDIHFHGRDADLLLRDNRLLRCKENRVEPIIDLLPAQNPASAFLDAMQSGKPTISPASIALPIFDWTTAVRRSIESQTWVEV